MTEDILFGFFMYGAGLLASGIAIEISLEIVKPLLIPSGITFMVLMLFGLLINNAKRKSK